ncbi:MAG: NAD(+)/NADH kinase [Spirochaetaceae bacterium]|nr:MAG: NAD(+)/NADH kinase [Spirochaetaceae bacterium]
MKREIKKVLAVMKRSKDLSRSIAEEFQEFFSQRKIKLVIHPFQERPRLKRSHVEDVDLALSRGGDGTLLYCSQLLAGADIPILAVNLGNFGFITEVTRNEWKDIFDKFEEGKTDVTTRIMLDVEVRRKGKRAVQFCGLNDGVIISSGISKIVRLEAFLSQTYIGRYRADGIIIATPTGSTAYSLAAGGPILHPEMEAFILCPICPFSISHRPLVVPANEFIEINVETTQRTNIILTVDGQNEFVLEPSDSVIFRKSIHSAHIIRSDKRNFYEVLRTKLNWSGEPNA